MLTLTIEQLKEMGVSTISSSTLTLDDKQFQIGPTFSLKMRSAAIDFCEQKESEGCECLLVENANAITIWNQKKSISIEKSKSESSQEEFVKRCHQELKKCIGPMATLIIDELVNGPEPLTGSQLVARIAAQIPDRKLANEFRNMFKK